MRTFHILLMLGCVLVLALIVSEAQAFSCSSWSGSYGGASGTWHEWSSGGGSTITIFVETGSSVTHSQSYDASSGDMVLMDFWGDPGGTVGDYRSHEYLVWFCEDWCGSHGMTSDPGHSHADWARGQTEFAYANCVG